MRPDNDTFDEATETPFPHEVPTTDFETLAYKTNGNPADGGVAPNMALQSEVEDLKAKLEKAEKDNLYLQAEFQNYRRRKEDEFKSQQKYLSENLLKEILPAVDNFERALLAAEQSQSFDKLISGVNGTLKQLHTLLLKAGVAPIEAVGKEFDPNFHEAIGHVDDSVHPANTVAEEVQRGYLLHDRVLRPALVKVAS